MPRLNFILPVLENNLHEFAVIRVEDGGLEVGASPRGVGRHASEVEDSRNLKVVGEFQRRVRRNIGHAVDSIPLLPINPSIRIRKHDCTAWLDHTVVV